MAPRLTLTDLPEALPVFPLPGALLLPRARLPLNIFEPRYLAMLDDVLKVPDRLIGMIQPRETDDDDPSPLYDVGCAGRVTSFSETEDGRYLIALSGVSRFQVVREIEGFSPYRRVEADWGFFEDDLTVEDDDPDFDRTSFMSLLERYFSARNLSGDWGELGEADDEMLINSLSIVCPFETQEKQALLEARDLVARRETLTTLLTFAVAGAGSESGLQ